MPNTRARKRERDKLNSTGHVYLYIIYACVCVRSRKRKLYQVDIYTYICVQHTPVSHAGACDKNRKIKY